MAFVRLVVFGFIALTVVYVLVSLYSRSVRREKLENLWAEEHPGSEDMAARAAFIESGMQRYQNGLRRRLILLVYIIPVLLVAGIHIVTTYT